MNIPKDVLDKIYAESERLYPYQEATVFNAGEIGRRQRNKVDADRNTFSANAAFGYSLSQSELAEKDKRIEELKDEINRNHYRYLESSQKQQKLLTEANKEIEKKEALLSACEIALKWGNENIAELNKQINQLKQDIGTWIIREAVLEGLIEDAYIQGRNDQINHVENGWEQFKAEKNI